MSMCGRSLSSGSKTQALSFHSHCDLTTRQSSQSLVYAFQDNMVPKQASPGQRAYIMLGSQGISRFQEGLSSLAMHKSKLETYAHVAHGCSFVFRDGLTYKRLPVSLLCENLRVPVSSGKRLRFLKLRSVLRCP